MPRAAISVITITPIFTRLETFESLDALGLRAIRVQDGDRVIGRFELSRDFVGTVFGAGKNQAALEICFFEQGDQ